MKCCICKKKIETVRGWEEGHNAEPIKKGRCCEHCNLTVVLAARLKGGTR